MAVIGLGHRGPGLRANAGIIVAGELLGFAGHAAASRFIDRAVQDVENCASIKAATKRGIAAVRSPTSRTRWMAQSSGCACRARLASIRPRNASPEVSTCRTRIIAVV